jgi:hypothetical protein
VIVTKVISIISFDRKYGMFEDPKCIVCVRLQRMRWWGELCKMRLEKQAGTRQHRCPVSLIMNSGLHLKSNNKPLKFSLLMT